MHTAWMLNREDGAREGVKKPQGHVGCRAELGEQNEEQGRATVTTIALSLVGSEP